MNQSDVIKGMLRDLKNRGKVIKVLARENKELRKQVSKMTKEIYLWRANEQLVLDKAQKGETFAIVTNQG